MKISKNYLLEKCVSNKENRFALEQIGIDDGRAIATNGKVLVSVPIENAPCENGRTTIPPDVLTQARKLSHKKEDTAQILIGANNDTYILNNGATIPNTIPDAFPFVGVKQIIEGLEKGNNHDVTVALDAELLYKISQAMGDKLLVLKIRTTDKITYSPIIVERHGDHHAESWDNRPFGILMPVNLKK
jgi:hypothetical protein